MCRYLSTQTYVWDAGNRLTQIQDSVAGTLNRTPDNFDRLQREQGPQGQIDYTYYPDGRRKTMTVLGQAAVNYTWDAAGRLRVIQQGSAAVGFVYDDADRRTLLVLPNGIRAGYGWDDGNQLNILAWYKPDTSLLGYFTYG